MSTLTQGNRERTERLPLPLRDKLVRLRRALRRNVLVSGLSVFLLLLLAVLLVDLALDWMFRMDLPQRIIMLVLIVAAAAWWLVRRVLAPLGDPAGDDALVLRVEDANAELGDNLIAAVQLSRDGPALAGAGSSQMLVDETIRRGVARAETVDFEATLDRRAHARNQMLLVAGVVGLLGLAAASVSTDFFRTWFNRNILLTADEWPRNTNLEIVGVRDGALALPRGEDYRLLVEVLESSRDSDVEVTIEFDDGTTRSRQKMRTTGKLDGREHLLVFRQVNREFQFRAIGGDHTTDWVTVQLLETPAWKELEMSVRYPDYTGRGREVLPSGGGPYSLLTGSTLSIRAEPNKPLSEAVLRAQDLAWPIPVNDEGQYALDLPVDALQAEKYTFDLADEAGLRSGRPAAFTVSVRPDRSPDVVAELLGISNMVVPRARIPVDWHAEDDFAVAEAWFDYEWSAESSASVPSSGSLNLAEAGRETGALLGTADIRTVDVLDLERFDVPVNVSLKLTVRVVDNNTLNGPGSGTSQTFTLRVVSEEELRADLLRREIEQRKAFQSLVNNQESFEVDVRAAAATLADSAAPLPESDAAGEILTWQRRQKLIGTNMAQIADRFEEYLVEVKNNRLDEAENEINPAQSIEVRFLDRIIGPIRQLDETEVVASGRLLDKASRVRENRQQLAAALDEVAAKQAEILREMTSILDAMENSEDFQSIVNKAIEVKRSQEGVRDLTREEKNRVDTEDIFDDAPDDGIFEDDR